MPLISLPDATSALNSLSANSRPLGPLSCCWTRFWFSQMAPSIRVPQQPPRSPRSLAVLFFFFSFAAAGAAATLVLLLRTYDQLTYLPLWLLPN